MVKHLKNWTLFAATATLGVAGLLSGCGGGGSTANTTGGLSSGGGGNGRLPTVTLNNFANVQMVFLSGAGRRAPGDLVAVIQQIQIERTNAQGQQEFAPNTDQLLLPRLNIQLNGYTLNSRTFNVRLEQGEPGRLYDKFPFEIYSLAQINDQGGLDDLTSSNPAFVADPPLELSAGLLPGRQTSIQIALDDQTITYDNTNGLVFDRALFETKNYDPFTNSIRGFLSDYFYFDISGMPANLRPVRNNGSLSDAVLFSGDAIGISTGLDTPENFEVLSPQRIEFGTITKTPLPGSDVPYGSYTLQELDPRDLTGTAKIASLQGYWRPYTQVLGNLNTAFMIAFPSSEELFPTSSGQNQQQVIYVQRNGGGTIIDMYAGTITYDASGPTAPTGGTIKLYPINQLPSGSAENEISGTVSNLVTQPFNIYDESGQIVPVSYFVRSGDFSLTTIGAATFSLPQSGSFVVLRK